jgi:hypothetical protein
MKLKNKLLLSIGLRAGVVEGIISSGTAGVIYEILVEDIEVWDIDRILIAMAKLTHGDDITPSGRKNSLKECIVDEPVIKSKLIYFNTNENESTHIHFINYQRR